MADNLFDWSRRALPDLPTVTRRYVTISPARFPDDFEALFAAIGGAANDDLWTYIPIGPFESAEAMGETLGLVVERGGWKTHLIRDAQSSQLLGMASYMRIRPEAGSVEVGCIVFSRALQKTPAATEAMFLMARHIFDDLGYRRYEWKCNNDNAGSKRAALRLGFAFEGVFRQDMVMKGRNRDTAWYSIIDSEWPACSAAFEIWLAPDNFDEEGRQRRALGEIRAALRAH
ncbi:MAG: GNAT family protein [Pseudomonadota bacterium]